MKRPATSSEESEDEPSSKQLKTEDLEDCSTAEEIEPGDEVFLFECPHNFDPNLLLHNTLNVDGKTVIKSSTTKDKYVVEFSKERNGAFFIAPARKGHKLLFAPLLKRISLERQVKIPNEVVKTEEGNIPAFPRELRVRHPLLGADFESHMKQVARSLKILKRKHK